MVRDVQSGRKRWPSPAMMPILSKSVGEIGHNIRSRSPPVSGAARFAPCWQCLQAMKRELRTT
jgi:hypothetical protein